MWEKEGSVAEKISVAMSVTKEVTFDESVIHIIAGGGGQDSIVWARADTGHDAQEDAKVLLKWLHAKVPSATVAALRRLMREVS